MKLLTLAMILVVIQLSIGLFDLTIDIDGETAIPETAGTNVSVNSTTNYLYDFVTNPHGWSNTELILFLVGITVAITAGSIVAGIFKYQPSDTIYFASAFTLLLGLGSIPVVSLFNVINREIGAFACVAGSYCTPAIIVATLTAGLLGLAWIFACINWWRTGVT